MSCYLLLRLARSGYLSGDSMFASCYFLLYFRLFSCHFLLPFGRVPAISCYALCYFLPFLLILPIMSRFCVPLIFSFFVIACCPYSYFLLFLVTYPYPLVIFCYFLLVLVLLSVVSHYCLLCPVFPRAISGYVLLSFPLFLVISF